MKKTTQTSEVIRLVADAKIRHTCHKKKGYETYLSICKKQERKPLTENSFYKCCNGAFYNSYVHEAWLNLNREPRTKRAKL